MSELINLSSVMVVDTYTELLETSIPPASNIAWVRNATADPTVKKGAALYAYNELTDTWNKYYETEVMDPKVSIIYNLPTLRKFSEMEDELYFDDKRIPLITDIVTIIEETIEPIVGDIISTTVNPVIEQLVLDNIDSIVNTLNSNITSMATTLRGEFAAADVVVLSTVDGKISTAISNMNVIASATSTNAITVSVVDKDLKSTLKLDTTVADNIATVTNYGLYVKSEFPIDADANDIMMFNGETWNPTPISNIPSTLSWTTV